MGRLDQQASKEFEVTQTSGGETGGNQWQFLGFDAEYRPVQIHTVTNRIRTLDQFTVLLDGSDNLKYVPM